MVVLPASLRLDSPQPLFSYVGVVGLFLCLGWSFCRRRRRRRFWCRGIVWRWCVGFRGWLWLVGCILDVVDFVIVAIVVFEPFPRLQLPLLLLRPSSPPLCRAVALADGGDVSQPLPCTGREYRDPVGGHWVYPRQRADVVSRAGDWVRERR